MTSNVFDQSPDVFDAMIDWSKRLANEGPFYQRLFGRLGVSRVLDVACGTGAHAALFASWGLQVEGADTSQPMLEIARKRHGSSDRLSWLQRGFDQPATAAPFDAAICVGNSLALAGDQQTAQQAIRQMLLALRPGGVAVVHLLNIWSIPPGPCDWTKSVRRTLNGSETIILRGVHRSQEQAFIEIVVLDINTGARLWTHSVPMLPLTHTQLNKTAREAGASDFCFYGDYHDQPYDPATSLDLIMVATKGT